MATNVTVTGFAYTQKDHHDSLDYTGTRETQKGGDSVSSNSEHLKSLEHLPSACTCHCAQCKPATDCRTDATLEMAQGLFFNV